MSDFEVNRPVPDRSHYCSFLYRIMCCNFLKVSHLIFSAQVSIRRAAVSSISMQALDELKLFVGGLPWAMDNDSLREV